MAVLKFDPSGANKALDAEIALRDVASVSHEADDELSQLEATIDWLKKLLVERHAEIERLRVELADITGDPTYLQREDC